MTDNEIIKALECCIASSTVLACADCPLLDTRECIGKPKTYVSNYIVEQGIDLINRQRAEIERLKSMNQAKLDTIHDLMADVEMLNAEKIIAERKEKDARELYKEVVTQKEK